MVWSLVQDSCPRNPCLMGFPELHSKTKQNHVKRVFARVVTSSYGAEAGRCWHVGCLLVQSTCWHEPCTISESKSNKRWWSLSFLPLPKIENAWQRYAGVTQNFAVSHTGNTHASQGCLCLVTQKLLKKNTALLLAYHLFHLYGNIFPSSLLSRC